MLALIAVIVAVLLLWMNFASLDISVHASGKVIPAAACKQIQSLEGGNHRGLQVHEGRA